MMVHLDTTEIVQAEIGQLDELSEAMARKAGNDCAVEIV
jgi:hypothetical protein